MSMSTEGNDDDFEGSMVVEYGVWLWWRGLWFHLWACIWPHRSEHRGLKLPSLSALSASRLYPLETGPGGDHRHDEDEQNMIMDTLKILTNALATVMLMLNKDTYFTPINEDRESRQSDPNKSVEGNCEGVDTLDLHQEVHPRRNCMKGHQPL